jgi:hypothetical protein
MKRENFGFFDRTADCPHEAAINCADLMTYDAHNAITAIPRGLIDERVVMNLIVATRARLAACGWGHQEHAVDASEKLLDAFTILEAAAETKEME